MSARKFAISLAGLVLAAWSAQAKKSDNNDRLWFDYPAAHWNSQALHIGNGHLGGSFYGGVAQERFDITEKTMWFGGPQANHGVIPGGKEHIQEIRDAVVSGDYAKADALTSRYMRGDCSRHGAFSMIGNLYFDFAGHDGAVAGYRRELDLSESLGKVSYSVGGIGYQREYFCSYPDRVMVARFTSDTPGALTVTIRHGLTQKQRTVTVSGKEMLIKGKIDGNGRAYCVRIRALVEGGTIQPGGDTLNVVGSDSVTVLYAAATEYLPVPPMYRGADPEAVTGDQIRQAVSKGYDQLRAVHIADYRSLYDRVELTLAGDPDAERLPTNQRWEGLKRGDLDDAGLKVLLFNLGRYLIISASRPGSLPSTLQGNWNTFRSAPWGGNYQSNINLQEMYWPCGPTDLLECQEAYVDWITRLVTPGRAVAEAYYGTKGWVSHLTGNIWGFAAPHTGSPRHHYPVAAAWHCQHLWDQYAFSMDKAYLEKTAYPVMKEAAEFWLANLVPYKGYLISTPSGSSEHAVQELNGEFTDNTIGIDAGNPRDGSVYRGTLPGTYQDIETIHDLFSNVIEASKVLGVDKTFSEQVDRTRGKLLPLKIGRYGQLQEWDLDIDSPKNHHRHISHLYAVHPGRMIHPLTTPELAEAAKTSLNMRGDGYAGPKWPYSGGNWARTWRIWCWARLLDGERALKIFDEQVIEQGFENLMTCQQTPGSRNMQVDGSMSTPGFMSEMLLQSHLREIHLLPALPQRWHAGSVKGLLARGGSRIDMEWKYGHLIRARIESRHGSRIPRVRVAGETVDLDTDPRFQPQVSINRTAGRAVLLTAYGTGVDRVVYTTDGSKPSVRSKAYASPFKLRAGRSVTVKAQCVRDGRLVGPLAAAPFATPPPAPDVYLDSLKAVKFSTGWWGGTGNAVWKNVNCHGKPLSVRGKRFDHGVGLHAAGEIVFTVAPDYTHFQAGIGLDDAAGSKGTARVRIYQDETLLHETPVIKGGTELRYVQVKLSKTSGPSVLRIVVGDGGDGYDFDNVNLVDAGLLVQKKPGNDKPRKSQVTRMDLLVLPWSLAPLPAECNLSRDIAKTGGLLSP